MAFRHPLSLYVIMSDKNDKILSSATSIRKAKSLRKQFEDSMGQGAPPVKIWKVEELTEVKEGQ